MFGGLGHILFLFPMLISDSVCGVTKGVICQDLTLSQKSERLYCHMLTHGNNYYSGVGCNVNAYKKKHEESQLVC